MATDILIEQRSESILRVYAPSNAASDADLNNLDGVLASSRINKSRINPNVMEVQIEVDPRYTIEEVVQNITSLLNPDGGKNTKFVPLSKESAKE